MPCMCNKSHLFISLFESCVDKGDLGSSGNGMGWCCYNCLASPRNMSHDSTLYCIFGSGAIFTRCNLHLSSLHTQIFLLFLLLLFFHLFYSNIEIKICFFNSQSRPSIAAMILIPILLRRSVTIIING